MTNNKSFEQHWADFSKWWGTQSPNQDIQPFEKHLIDHPLFSTAMTMNRSMAVVVDLRSMQLLFATGDVEGLTGISQEVGLKGGVKLAFALLHPDDLVVGPLFGQLVAPYFKALPETEKPQYRSYWDWRFVKNNGDQIRVLAQDSILKHDEEGNMILLLSMMTDIATSKSDRHNHLRMTNGIENLLYEYNQIDKKLYKLQCPSDRELDVFRHISRGYQRKQIADKLGISLATVKTHCQHVFEKLRTTDSVETINLIKVLGLL